MRINQSTSTRNEELQNKLPAASRQAEPARKNHFLQNKLPAASRQAEPVRKKPLFAKQTAGGQSSSRARAKKTTFCKTNCWRSVVEPSPRGKTTFLQNKMPAVSRQAEHVRKKPLFARQRSVTINPAKCYMHGLAGRRRPRINSSWYACPLFAERRQLGVLDGLRMTDW